MNVAATITLTPGTVISRLTSGQLSASAAMTCSTAAISPSRKSTWRHRRVDGLALDDRQLLLGQPGAALDTEQIRRRRAVLQTAHQRRVDLVLRARPGPHELLAARQPPAHRADPLVGRPHRVELTGPQQLGQRTGVQPVGLRARLPDPGVRGRDDDHPRDMPLENPGDLPRVAGHLQRDEIARRQAPRRAPALQGAPRPDRRTSRSLRRRSRPRRSRDARPTPLLSPTPSSPNDDLAGEPVGNDIDGSALAAQPGKSRGAATEKPGLQHAHRPNRPAQPAFSQGPLVPSGEPKPPPGRDPHRAVSCPEKRQPT